MPEIDHTAVDQYWSGVKASVLGPYMMDGFGFPASAGHYRFRAESGIVKRLLRDVDPNGSVLDLGCGVGYWAEAFAHRFSRVVAVEGSGALYQALEERCAPYPNIRPVLGNVLSFEPERYYRVVFLGGLLMYLDEEHVTALLRRLITHLEPGGIILCRESTVRGKTETRAGDYPVVYRSVQDYRRIFKHCGLTIRQSERNEPYVLMQIGCELIKKWKGLVPKPFQMLGVVGPLAYWAMRLGNPWINRLPKALGIPFPKLENHFFVLEPEAS
ncbi:MAG TPA: class I SAM-dependent methyltransferase [Gammaproteobacteria bacterium]|nr:class I SAM-dependent methyltransferase [Gammaproteobacteria bacterium]